MKALIALATPGSPIVGQFVVPRSTEERPVCTVKAAALTNLDIIVAEGKHYFSSRQWPQVVGREAVVIAPSGERVFLTAKAISAPFGSMAERCPADLSYGLPVLPDVPDELAAALGNAGLAAWLSLSWRAALKPGETVLVLGATGASGRIAAAAAKLLGAQRIIVAGRNRSMLDHLLVRGADAAIQLEGEHDLAKAYRAAAPDGVDVVVDFLNGPPAEAALASLRIGGRMIQIGSPLASSTAVNAQMARRNCLDVLGFAYYHAPIADQREAYRQLCVAALTGEVEIDHRSVRLDDADEAWSMQKQGSRDRWIVMP